MPQADVSDVIRIATSRLFLQHPFDAAVLASCTIEMTDSIPTAATDCLETIYMNPHFAEQYRSSSIAMVLAHECRHIVLMHGLRRPQADDPELAQVKAQLWNIATDFVINGQLDREGYDFSEFAAISLAEVCAAISHPEDNAMGDRIMLDRSLPDVSAENIYDALLRHYNWRYRRGRRRRPSMVIARAVGSGSATGRGDGMQPVKIAGVCTDDLMPCDDEHVGRRDTRAMERHIHGVIARATAIAGEGGGSLPPTIAATLDKLGQAKVDWRALLRRFAKQSIANIGERAGVSYQRPNRRALHYPFIRPSMPPGETPPIAVYFHCSGSVNMRLRQDFAAEIESIRQEMRSSELIVIYADHQVLKVDRLPPNATFSPAAIGGGGTRFEPVFAHLEETLRIRPAVFIGLTDGIGSYPEQAPDYPCIWALSRAMVNPPFGQRIVIEPNQRVSFVDT
jgi:predicted metal-dependent peptidase